MVWLVGYVLRLCIARYSSSYVLIGFLGSWCRSGGCCVWLVDVDLVVAVGFYGFPVICGGCAASLRLVVGS